MPEFDILIRGGSVIDGSGAPRVTADVGIRGDRIAAIGALERPALRARSTPRAWVLAPGFIDVHNTLTAGC